MSGKTTFSIQPQVKAIAKIHNLQYEQEAQAGTTIQITVTAINKGNVSGVLHMRLYSIAEDNITNITPITGDIWDSKAASPECSGHTTSYTTFTYTFTVTIPQSIQQIYTLGIKVWSEDETEPNFEV